MRGLLTIILSGLCLFCVGQNERTKQIDVAVGLINSHARLTLKEFDAKEIYKQNFDGGGVIKLYSEEGKVRKIEQEITLSFGRVTTIVYLENLEPIQIIEREEDYVFKDDQTTLDHSKLNQVFEAIIYVIDWDKDDSFVVIEGKRVLSEGTCSNYEYEPLIDIAQKVLRN
jgi:hypothetical protein